MPVYVSCAAIGTLNETVASYSINSFLIIDKSLGIVRHFCYNDIHVDRNENEDCKRVSSCPQSTASSHWL